MHIRLHLFHLHMSDVGNVAFGCEKDWLVLYVGLATFQQVGDVI